MILNKDMQEVYQPLVPYMPAEPMVGYGYVPYQITPDVMDIDQAYMAGTLFPDLSTPYNKYLKREV